MLPAPRMPPRRSLRWIGVIGLLALLVPSVAYAASLQEPSVSQPYWPAFPQSPQARSTQEIFWVIIGLAFVILAIVEFGLLYIIIRYRARPGQPEPRQISVNQRLEFWWTIIPTAMLVGAFVYTVRTVNSLLTIPSNALPITVIGHQWWWELKYPTLGVTTANEIHVPAGTPIRFTLESADVVHNFWIPVLGGKEQLIPGHVNTWSYTAEKPGTYDGECSEFCGGPHAWMRLKLIAQTPAAFKVWAAHEKQPAMLPSGPQALKASALFNQNACAQCHAIRGTSANGRVAPELTHIGSQETIGAGRLKNTEVNMAAWLHDAQRYKPGSYMPNLHLSRTQSTILAKWLEDLK
ncbi:MAG: cytochrome c oxidase subunit II [Chloroflexota bacterium]